MNTQLNTKTRLSLFSPNFVTLLIGIITMLVLGSPSVQAQTSTAATDAVDSSVTFTAKGTVNDPGGAVTVSGSVIVNCRRVIDNTAAAAVPLVLLDFDFSQLKGTSGSAKTTLKTYTTGDNHASEIRPLQASDTIIVTSPYFDPTKGLLSAKTFLVTATLKFDVTTGKLTSGTISLGDNVVTAAAVGTVVAAQ